MVAAALASTAIAFDVCDWGHVYEEGPWQHDEMCDGDPQDLIWMDKTAVIAAQVRCRENNWKDVPVDLTNWEVYAFAACEQAPEGQPPACLPDTAHAYHWGIEGGNHKFKWQVRSVSADTDGIGCIPDASYVEFETTLSAPGCCAAGCQDAPARPIHRAGIIRQDVGVNRGRHVSHLRTA
jgi:hypothetical protein